MPSLEQLRPMELGTRKLPFTDPAWGFEVKYDGYRMLAEVDAGRVRLQTRNGADATAWFPEIARPLAGMPAGRHIVDGEVCVLDGIGRSDFDRLQDRARLRRYRPGADLVAFCVFDVLSLAAAM